jgi:hypothetical protein
VEVERVQSGTVATRTLRGSYHLSRLVYATRSQLDHKECALLSYLADNAPHTSQPIPGDKGEKTRKDSNVHSSPFPTAEQGLSQATTTNIPSTATVAIPTPASMILPAAPDDCAGAAVPEDEAGRPLDTEPEAEGEAAVVCGGYVEPRGLISKTGDSA